MSYSSDFRKCVLDFVDNGGSKAEASRRFGISRGIIYEWLDAEAPLTSKKPGPQGPRTLDYALQQHVADFCHPTGACCPFWRLETWYLVLKKLNIEKKDDVKEQCPVKRREYLSVLQLRKGQKVGLY